LDDRRQPLVAVDGTEVNEEAVEIQHDLVGGLR